jgi:hypothetical protein
MMGAMTHHDDDVICPAPDVCSRVLDGDAVLLDLNTGTYFGLNEVGSRFWELLGQQGRRLGDIKRSLLEEFDVDEPTLSRDLEELLHTLDEKRLVVTRRS